MMNKRYLKKQWLLRGGLGASLTGLGVCAVVESSFFKYDGVVWYQWAGLGTLSLIVFVSGICLLIDAVRFRIKLDESI